ncbi:MAG: cytochrome c3 family protein [Desulfobacterales bacterium]|jgi:formate-dependent nitrite reductase cytochrome c552 subunit
MKLQTKLLIIAATLFLGGLAMAGDTLKQFGDIKGRSYHAEYYEDEACDVCHGNAEGKGIPDDFVCLDCHDADEMMEATSRPGNENWMNPHDSLHYGTDVPCMECHGEHEARQHLCANCHAFDYPNFKM